MERPKENGGVMGWGPEKGEWFGAHGGAPPPPRPRIKGWESSRKSGP